MSPKRLAGSALIGVAVMLAVGSAAAVPRAGARATGTAPTEATSLEAAIAAATPASKPFPALTETEVRVGHTTLRVVVADDNAERTEGLRRRSSLGPYDGMLFVFDTPTTTPFTMSTVPVPLSIGFYAGRGRVVDRLRMEPCAGGEADCPTYRASGSFRYALETLAGDLPRGRLRG